MNGYGYFHGVKDRMFVLYTCNIKNIFCHLERKINLDILENSILFWLSFQVKGHRSVLLHGTIQRSLNRVSISYHVTLYHPIKSQEST